MHFYIQPCVPPYATRYAKRYNKPYSKQYNEYSCGPIALFNFLKFHGCYQPFRRLMEWTKCSPEHGTSTCKFKKVLTAFEKEICFTNKDNWLVEWIHPHKQTSEPPHFMFIFKRASGKYLATNYILNHKNRIRYQKTYHLSQKQFSEVVRNSNILFGEAI